MVRELYLNKADIFKNLRYTCHQDSNNAPPESSPFIGQQGFSEYRLIIQKMLLQILPLSPRRVCLPN